MKARNLSCILATLSILLATKTLFAQGTAFTYQGRLNVGTGVANGSYDLTFSLFGVSSGAGQVGSTLTSTALPVSNGLFTVTLDFGNEFSGADRWLEIAVRTNGGGAFTTLTPRQQITASPYAIRAANVDAAGLAGTIPSSSLSGSYTEPVTFDNTANNYSGTFYGSFLGLSFIGGSFAGSFVGNGSGLANLNGAQITSGTIPGTVLNNAWRTVGNSGTIPGTHFIGNTDNKPLEFRVNNQRVLHIGTNANGSPNLVAGSPANSITGTNTEGSTIAGGGIGLYPNTITASYATIGGGTFHLVNGAWSTIAGGRDNIVQADHSTVGGGHGNIIRPSLGYSTIAGGAFNELNTNAYYGTIGGGYLNSVAQGSFAAMIGGGLQNNIGINSGYSTIGGGLQNNVTDSFVATIAGGANNQIGTNAITSTISGGYGNNIGHNSSSATIAGGSQNIIHLNASTALIGGGLNNKIGSGSFAATIVAGSDQIIGDDSIGSTITGGDRNSIGNNSVRAFIGGGSQNAIFSNSLAVVGGGFFNQIGGTTRITTTSLFSNQGNTVAGGSGNFITDGTRGATIGGGNNNTVLTNGDFAMIPGGEFNDATNYAFAAGRLARANHQGAFVWADSTFASVASLSPDSVTMRASGGYRLFSNSGATAGVSLAPGATAWGVLSDRNAKKDFSPVDNRVILEKLAALPITQWHYRWEEEGATPHIGPMAQDFKAAFYPGRDDKSITTQETDGVALAAIQGLNEKVEVRTRKSEDRMQQLETENAELKQRLEKLENLLQNHR